jgi:glyoxylase-like metal-dependent hydrolase (beta-lactamase superfamily II)
MEFRSQPTERTEEKTMLDEMNRRNFLELGAAAGAAFMAPRWMAAQSAPAAGQAAKPRDDAASTAVKATKLYDNLYLLQGQGGNMALQTGADGNLLIDSSYAAAVPRIREAIAALAPESASVPGILVNTHWHGDHTGGNEGMHAAGFTIVAHRLTRARLSTPQTMTLFHRTVPASPAGALPHICLDDGLSIWRNGDTLDLAHFEPAHTDGDIYIYFRKADVLHVGDIWFNGMYPFIDESAGGSIGGMIRASEKALAVAGNSTRIIPGHGPVGTKANLQSFRDLLMAVRDKVAALKAGGASEQEAVAKNPTAEFDAAWGKGFMNGGEFAGIVYRTL